MIGSFLGGLFRCVFPLLKKGSTAVGEELFKTGVGVAKDLWKTGDLNDTQKRRGKEFVNNVSNRFAEHMFGGSYIPHIGARLQQLKRKVRRRKTRVGKVTKKRVSKKKKTVKRKPVKKGGKKKKKRTTRSKKNIYDIFS